MLCKLKKTKYLAMAFLSILTWLVPWLWLLWLMEFSRKANVTCWSCKVALGLLSLSLFISLSLTRTHRHKHIHTHRHVRQKTEVYQSLSVYLWHEPWFSDNNEIKKKKKRSRMVSCLLTPPKKSFTEFLDKKTLVISF